MVGSNLGQKIFNPIQWIQCFVSAVHAVGVMVWANFSWDTLRPLVPAKHPLNEKITAKGKGLTKSAGKVDFGELDTHLGLLGDHRHCEEKREEFHLSISWGNKLLCGLSLLVWSCWLVPTGVSASGKYGQYTSVLRQTQEWEKCIVEQKNNSLLDLDFHGGILSWRVRKEKVPLIIIIVINLIIWFSSYESCVFPVFSFY